LILIFISGLDLFKASMAYVALSRAKQLKHVYIIDFDVSVLKCNGECVLEYNRLKKKKNYPEITIYNVLPFETKGNKYNQNTINNFLKNDVKNAIVENNSILNSLKRSAATTFNQQSKKKIYLIIQILTSFDLKIMIMHVIQILLFNYYCLVMIIY
jgi:hypothetical protein